MNERVCEILRRLVKGKAATPAISHSLNPNSGLWFPLVGQVRCLGRTNGFRLTPCAFWLRLVPSWVSRVKIRMRVAVNGGSEDNPGRCLSDVSFHLQTIQTSLAHAYEPKGKRVILKGKFIFYVMESASYFSSLGIYLSGPLSCLDRLFCCQIRGCFWMVPGCGSGDCPSPCAVNSPCLLALGVSEGLSGQKERSGTGDVGTRWELPWAVQM